MSTKSEQYAEIVLPIDIYHTDREAYLEKLQHLIKMENNEVVVECIHLKTISSSHVSLLWEMLMVCQKCDVKLKLQNISESIQQVLKVLDIKEFFPLVNEEPIYSPAVSTNRITTVELEPIHFEFSPTTEEIVRCKFTIGNFLKDACIPYNTVYEIETIFYELATNIRLHGLHTHERYVSVDINQVNNVLVMVFTDNCQPFDPTSKLMAYDPESAIKQGMKNGLGIVMVGKMSDSVTYVRKNDENILTVKKSWSS